MFGSNARGFALILIFLAMALIAVGRRNVRAARRRNAEGARARTSWAGWIFCALGLFLMIAGVVLW
jgi:hypothetical protein